MRRLISLRMVGRGRNLSASWAFVDEVVHESMKTGSARVERVV